MKTLVIKSNHGNHTGYNRTWEILSKHDTIKEARKELCEIAKELDDTIKCTKKYLDSFEYDLHYYRVITRTDLDLFTGGHYGYMPNEVKEFFK